METLQWPPDIEFEIEPTVWVKGSVILTFPHYDREYMCTLMCVILKYTDDTVASGIYYVRSIGQCKGWR